MPKKRLKILAIDNNQENLIRLQAILQETVPEASLKLASTGRKGLELALVDEPDVVLLDIFMPDFNGYEVCREIKENERLRSIPVVFLSGSKTDEKSYIRALEVGAEAFLTKPLDKEELTSVVRAMVKIKEANEIREQEKRRLSKLVTERTGKLELEASKRSHAEKELTSANTKLRKSQKALMNMLEDLKTENLARQLSEKDLFESREKYKLLFTEMTEGFAFHEILCNKAGTPVDYRFLEVNQAFESMTGLKASDVVGKRVKEVLPGIEKIWIKTYGKVALTGVPTEFNQFSGNLKRSYRVSVFSPEKGKFATVFTDITERLEMEQALKASEYKFRGITEQITDLIFMTDRSGKLLYVSPASIHIFGYTPDEMIGNHFEKFLVKDQIRFAKQKFRVAMKSKRTDKDLIIEMKRKEGSVFQGELQSAPYMVEGEMVGTLGVVRDITDRIEAEKKLRESAQVLRDLTTHIEEIREEERKGIAQDLHDDLGQKLTALNIDLAWLAGRIPVDYPELSEKINGMHGILMEVIGKVKQISTELRPSVLDDLGIGAAITWQASDFTTHTDTPCKVSLIPEDIEMPAKTSTQVFRIVQESLTNIMRHAEASYVQISLIQKEKTWRLRIKDNGEGFSPEEIENKKSFGLTGMSERAKLCGGTLRVKSSPGKGTEIVVEIPISKQ